MNSNIFSLTQLRLRNRAKDLTRARMREKEKTWWKGQKSKTNQQKGSRGSTRYTLIGKKQKPSEGMREGKETRER